MQTFVPFIGFHKSAAVLDTARLGKQRIETLQILGSIANGTGYKHHPVNDMWRGYESALVLYGLAVCHEWRIVRGYADETWGKFADLVCDGPHRPPWAGDKDVHRSHRSNLIRKDSRYKQVFPNQAANWPYLWPKIDDSDSRGYRLYLCKADAVGRGLFLPEWLRMEEKTREVLDA